ncbi:MAG: putative toxin-antitoxin system toxin component, PIN family [Candidatus Levybacteria bacterium]|nr:putative toxin-antitoxin system toxin component, PIN family [Candidatus Levybacteria bacterium]
MASDQTKVSKIFIDSSVLIAASISPKGSARDLILSSIRGEYEIIISDLVIEETRRNLGEKAPEALPALQLFLESLNPEVIKPSKSLVTKAAKIIDLKDAPIVAAAISSKADYLVSFDRKHLLYHKRELKEDFELKVVTPDEMIK